MDSLFNRLFNKPASSSPPPRTRKSSKKKYNHKDEKGKEKANHDSQNTNAGANNRKHQVANRNKPSHPLYPEPINMKGWLCDAGTPTGVIDPFRQWATGTDEDTEDELDFLLASRGTSPLIRRVESIKVNSYMPTLTTASTPFMMPPSPVPLLKRRTVQQLPQVPLPFHHLHIQPDDQQQNQPQPLFSSRRSSLTTTDSCSDIDQIMSLTPHRLKKSFSSDMNMSNHRLEERTKSHPTLQRSNTVSEGVVHTKATDGDTSQETTLEENIAELKRMFMIRE